MRTLQVALLAVLPAMAACGHHVPRATPCRFVTLAVSGDTCETLAVEWGLSETQFKDLNPDVMDCANLSTSKTYCVGPLPTTISTTEPAPSPTDRHEPHQDPIVADCKTWYKVQSGDNCWKIETTKNISHSDFRKWNAFVDDGCSNLFKDYWVCIGV